MWMFLIDVVDMVFTMVFYYDQDTVQLPNGEIVQVSQLSSDRLILHKSTAGLIKNNVLSSAGYLAHTGSLFNGPSLGELCPNCPVQPI